MTALEKRERKEHLLDELTALAERGVVHLRLQDEDSLFNPYDPAPAEERDLNPDAVDYLMEQLDKQPGKLRIEADISVPGAEKYGAHTLCEAFKNYFAKKAEEQILTNKRVFRKWTVNLICGLVFLAACLIMAHIFNMNSERHPFFSVLGESLSIIGWVAIWEPATYFLYGIRGDLKTLRAYMLLHRAEVNIVTAKDPHSAGSGTEENTARG